MVGVGEASHCRIRVPPAAGGVLHRHVDGAVGVGRESDLQEAGERRDAEGPRDPLAVHGLHGEAADRPHGPLDGLHGGEEPEPASGFLRGVFEKGQREEAGGGGGAAGSSGRNEGAVRLGGVAASGASRGDGAGPASGEYVIVTCWCAGVCWLLSMDMCVITTTVFTVFTQMLRFLSQQTIAAQGRRLSSRLFSSTSQRIQRGGKTLWTLRALQGAKPSPLIYLQQVRSISSMHKQYMKIESKQLA